MTKPTAFECNLQPWVPFKSRFHLQHFVQNYRGWKSSKKAWCCQNKDVACASHVPWQSVGVLACCPVIRSGWWIVCATWAMKKKSVRRENRWGNIHVLIYQCPLNGLFFWESRSPSTFTTYMGTFVRIPINQVVSSWLSKGLKSTTSWISCWAGRNSNTLSHRAPKL